jgi:hypothetical protein
MNRDQLLKHLGLSAHQLDDLLKKFHDFFNSLDEQQKHVVRRSVPSLKDASDSFGTAVNEHELLELLHGEAEKKPVMCFFPMVTKRKE